MGWNERYEDDYNPSQESINEDIDLQDIILGNSTTITTGNTAQGNLSFGDIIGHSWNEDIPTMDDNFVDIIMNREFLESMLRQLQDHHREIICAGQLINGRIDLTGR